MDKLCFWAAVQEILSVEIMDKFSGIRVILYSATPSLHSATLNVETATLNTETASLNTELFL